MRDVQGRSRFLYAWEKHRHSTAHFLVEMVAEFLGVFLYVYAGLGSQAGYVLGNVAKEAGLSSILQIGFSYCFGIVLAIAICSGTSGGHFNPCVSIAFTVFKGFPPLKALRYIVAQILGAYVAALIVYAQYHDQIVAAEAALAGAGALDAIQFTPQGPAGILALYVMPGSNLGRVFLNEFVNDTVLALVIWGCLDPTNILIPPPLVPFIIAFAYAMAIWGYSLPGLALNSARDIGGRLAALTIYGMQAGGGKYAAIAALTNIPAMLLGAFIYEVFLTDSDRVMPMAQREFLNVHKYHGQHGQHAREYDSGSDTKKQDIEHQV